MSDDRILVITFKPEQYSEVLPILAEITETYGTIELYEVVNNPKKSRLRYWVSKNTARELVHNNLATEISTPALDYYEINLLKET